MPGQPEFITLEEYQHSNQPEEDTLEKIVPCPRHDSTPPPGPEVDSDSEDSQEAEGTGSERKLRSGGAYFDVAAYAGTRTLTSRSPSVDVEPGDVNDEKRENDLMRVTPPSSTPNSLGVASEARCYTRHTTQRPQDAIIKLESTALDSHRDVDHVVDQHIRSPSYVSRPQHNPDVTQRTDSGSGVLTGSSRRQANMLPILRQLEILHSIEPPQLREDEDSTAMSPNLSRFTIRDGDPESTLPKLLHSPARTKSDTSSNGRHTLPSLHTTLSSLSDTSCSTPFTAQSPGFNRILSSYLPFGPSPSSYGSPKTAISPPRGISSQPSLWRTSRDASSMSTPSDYASASNCAPTPVSSVATESPDTTPQPTPTAATSDASPNVFHGASYDDDYPPMLDGDGSTNIPFASVFKCTWPDCTAAPFQTQYLLNSHANVHSNTRPHFCPVKNCPRGPGGQGFKRKNEMIRHGLVHTSPGYMCPFCMDQQHKYPRPDNLQRHVRVHHVDKDRDDPVLRDVLAQRAEGGSRGRRRRLGS